MRLPSAVGCWLAILLVRSAATNIGDVFHDLRVSFTVSIPVITEPLVAWVIAGRAGYERCLGGPRSPIGVVAWFWASIALVRSAGSAAGDWGAHAFGLGTTTLATTGYSS